MHVSLLVFAIFIQSVESTSSAPAALEVGCSSPALFPVNITAVGLPISISGSLHVGTGGGDYPEGDFPGGEIVLIPL